MTILKCSAIKCVYNKDQLCSKGEIDVTGENATSANETSCGSFQERTGSSMTNSFTNGCGCEKIQIDCSASLDGGGITFPLILPVSAAHSHKIRSNTGRKTA